MSDKLHFYCSCSTFLSIMKKRQLWLSSLNHSNDHLEGFWALEKYKEIANRTQRDGGSKVGAAMAPYFHERYAFGMCFSEVEDLLSQWRGYAEDGTGFSIAFSKDGLQELADRSEYTALGMKLSEVKYGRLEEHGFVKEIYDVFGADIRNVDFVGNSSFAQIELSRKKWATADKFYEFKNDAFLEEKEWRLYCVHSMSEGNDFEFSVRGHTILPHLQLNFDPKCVEHVMLGPRNKTPIKVVKTLMGQSGFEPRVAKSTASYR